MLARLSPILAEVSLDDVFKSTQQNMTQSPGSGTLMAMILGGLGIVLLLALVQMWRKRQAVPKPVNHHGRLLKQALKVLPLKSAELKQLNAVASEQGCSSPLTLLLCPSLLAKAAAQRSDDKRQALQQIADKLAPEARKQAA